MSVTALRAWAARAAAAAAALRQRGTSARARQASRPQSRRKALVMVERRLQRQRAAGAWQSQPFGPEPHAVRYASPRS